MSLQYFAHENVRNICSVLIFQRGLLRCLFYGVGNAKALIAEQATWYRFHAFLFYKQLPIGNLGYVLYFMRVPLLSFLLAASPFVSTMPLWSQDNQPKDIYVYPQKNKPESVDNYLFNTYYNSGKKAYNLRGLQMAKGSAPIVRMRVNPSGTSYAILEKENKAWR